MLMLSVAATRDVYDKAAADDLQAMAAFDEALDELLAVAGCDA